MLTKDQICKKFLANPNINPEKGTRLRRGYMPFNNYINLCRELGYDNEVELLLNPNKPIIKVEKEEKLLTGNYDIDLLLLELMDNQSLNNLEINNYARKILADQEFWKRRLSQRLGLTSKYKINYKYVTKFLDNGKTFEENYQEAIKGNKPEIVKLLEENRVVLKVKPEILLNDIAIPIDYLGESKYLSYEDFIEEMKGNSSYEYKDDKDYFDRKVYYGDGIIINIPDYYHYKGYDNANDNKKYVFVNKKGFTNGEILYAIAQVIPDTDEADVIIDNWYKEHPDEVLWNIKEQIEDLKLIHGDDVDVERLNKYYDPLIVKKLLKFPEEFKYYVKKYKGKVNIKNHDSTDIFGSESWIYRLFYNDYEAAYYIEFTEED